MVVLCAVAGASDGDDDLAPGVACFERPHGLGDLTQRVGPADARGELAGLEQLPQGLQVFLVLLGGQLLAAYLSAHRTMINGSALCAALAVTERD